jgi:hypothetical protein
MRLGVATLIGGRPPHQCRLNALTHPRPMKVEPPTPFKGAAAPLGWDPIGPPAQLTLSYDVLSSLLPLVSNGLAMGSGSWANMGLSSDAVHAVMSTAGMGRRATYEATLAVISVAERLASVLASSINQWVNEHTCFRVAKLPASDRTTSSDKRTWNGAGRVATSGDSAFSMDPSKTTVKPDCCN